MTAQKTPGTMGLVSILSISFVMMAFMATMPAMAALGAQFGAEYGQLLSLLSNGYVIAVVPVTLLSGWLTNSGRLKYRTATFIGSLLMLVGGVAPAVFHPSFEFLLIARLVFGVGLGLLTPLYNALILNFYSGNKQARYLGWTTLLMDFGGIIIQPLAGIIVDACGADGAGSGWYMHYWAYAMCIIPLVLSVFIPQPDTEAPAPSNDSPAADSSSVSPSAKEKLGAMAVIAGLFLLIVNLLNFPTMMYMSNVFIERSIGGAAAAGTTLSCVAIAGVFSGALYEKLFQWFKRLTPVVAFLFMACGAFLLYLASGLFMAMAGTCLFGFGFSMIIPACMTLVGICTPPSRVTLGTSIAMALMNLGGLVATPYLAVLEGIFGTGMPFYNAIFIVEALGFVLCAVILIIWNPYPKGFFGPKEK